MILRAYSIFDNKALQYHPPFFTSTDQAAIRMLRDLVDDNNTAVGRHPADYTLFLVGVWDDQNGYFEASRPLMHVTDAIALVKPDNTVMFKKEA